MYLNRVLELCFSEYEEINSYAIHVVLSRIYGDFSDSICQRINLSCITDLFYKYCSERNPKCFNCPINYFCRYWRKIQSASIDMKVPFIDLFCGAGGLSCGIEYSKYFHSVFALDHDESAMESYIFNRPWLLESNAITGDIMEVLGNKSIPNVPLVIGGPPCQGFSNANRQRLTDDPRNYLYKYFIQFVDRSSANVCIMENVPGMLTSREAIENDFYDIGFKIRPCIFNTKDFGYPQNRKRLFWLGIRTTNNDFYERVFGVFEKSIFEPLYDNVRFTLWDAIMDLPPLEAKSIKNASSIENERWGYTIDKVRIFDSPYCRLINDGLKETFLFNHKSKYNNERDIEIYRRLTPGEKSDADSIQDIMPYKSREDIFKDKFYKLEPLQPCKTITAHMYYDCHMYIHPSQARGLTPREAARIQGFPDNYFFQGSPNEWYRQIGNAVSPLAARHVGKALESIFSEFGELIK